MTAGGDVEAVLPVPQEGASAHRLPSSCQIARQHPVQVPDSCLYGTPIPRSLSQQPLRLKLPPVHLDHVVSTSEPCSQRWLLQEVLRGEVVLLGGCLQGPDSCTLQIPPCLLPASSAAYKKPADRSPMLPRPLQINKSCELNPGFAKASD